MKIGKRLKILRKKKGITLEQLSNKSGVALATLSRMENDKMPGTINAHISICKALSTTLSELYRDIENDQKTVENVPHLGRPEHIIHESGVKYELLVSDTANKKMTPIKINLSKNSSTDEEEHKVGTERFIYVISGAFDAVIEKKLYSLKEGDSLYFDASLSHQFINSGKASASAICVTYSQAL